MAAYAGFITHVTCRLTAKNRDQLRNPTLGNRVWVTFAFLSVAVASGHCDCSLFSKMGDWSVKIWILQCSGNCACVIFG